MDVVGPSRLPPLIIPLEGRPAQQFIAGVGGAQVGTDIVAPAVGIKIGLAGLVFTAGICVIGVSAKLAEQQRLAQAVAADNIGIALAGLIDI